MTLKTRKALFYLLLLAFMGLGVSAIFYSNGWRFDSETFTINKLGGIFFKRIPAGTTVFIEKNELKFEPGFLNSSLLIANLFPKTYAVKISKAGYQNWQKTLSVKPSLVTEVPPIILLPLSTDLGQPLAKKINDFWFGAKYLITRTLDNSLQFGNQKIAGREVVSWSEDGEKVITRSESAYFIVNLKTPKNATNLNPALKPPLIQAIQFHPQNNNELIIKTGAGLYLLNTQNLIPQLIIDKPPEAFLGNKDALILAIDGALFNLHLGDKTIKPVIKDNFGRVVRLELSPNKNYLALLNDKNRLYLIDLNNPQPKKLAENATSFQFSPDEQRIAFITKNKEIVIDSLRGDAAITILNIGIHEDGGFSWQRDSSYLFVQYPEALYLLEANNLPPINLQLITNNATKSFYKTEENSLYILKNENLYKLAVE